jgi:hypothetical protein
MFASKQWYKLSKDLGAENLVDYEINFVKDTRQDIRLYGATYLVVIYKRMITDFVSSQKFERFGMHLPTGTARFMKEKLNEEITKIESDLREEQVKIDILPEGGTCECKGTKEGIRKSKTRVLALINEITSKSKIYSSIGICTLFFRENGQRNIKGIEAGSNVIIKVDKELDTVEKESTQAEVEAIRAERARGKSKISQVPSTDPFDQCNFTTNEGLNVSCNYGNIAYERVSTMNIIIISP